MASTPSVSSPRPLRKLPLSAARPASRGPPGRASRAQRLCSPPLCATDTFGGQELKLQRLFKKKSTPKKTNTENRQKTHVRKLTQNKNPRSIIQRNVDTPCPSLRPRAPGEGARSSLLRGAQVLHVSLPGKTLTAPVHRGRLGTSSNT